MIQVKPGQKLPLSATIPDRTSGLVVKAVLEKMDGTALSTVTLTEVHPGVHTDQSFPMPANLDYLNAVYSVYESDGMTLYPSLGSWNELFGQSIPLIAAPLAVVLGTPEEQQVQGPLNVVQTSDFDVLLSFCEQQAPPSNNASLIADQPLVPVDIGQATAIVFRMKKADGTTLSKSLGSGISLVSGPKGQALLQLLAADLGTLPTGSLPAQVELDLGGVKHVLQVNVAIQLEASIV